MVTLWAFYAVTTLLALSLAFAFVTSLQNALADDDTVETIDTWVAERTPPEVQLGGPADDVRPESASGSASNASGEATVVNWREEAKLRRAAGVLLLANDYDGAMELLLQISAEDSRAFALDRLAHRKVLGALRGALVDERGVLALYESGSRGRTGGLGDHAARARVRRFTALPEEKLHLPEVAVRLPERVALTYIRNVHLRLARATKASDTLLALILGLGFPQDCDAARIYWEEFPTEYGDYGETL
jgi:hypothetical protein